MITKQKIKNKVSCLNLEAVNAIKIFPILPNYRVYKHNDLIECKSNFSAMEHRIIIISIAQIKRDDENLKMYKIPIRDVF